MAKSKFKMPHCSINPVTEKPYSVHKWEIVQGRLDAGKDGRIYYHVVCARPTCKLRSRNPVAF